MTDHAGRSATPVPQLKRFERLIGTWTLHGRTLESKDDNITGWSTFEWLPGGYFIKSVSEIRFDGFEAHSLEMIGYDAESKTFPSTVYSSMSGKAHSYRWDVEGDTVIHAGLGMTYRGVFSEDGMTLTGGWRPDEGEDEMNGSSYDAVMTRRASTRVSCHVSAPRSSVYRALIDPRAVAVWMVPDGMTSTVHEFEAREGGRFRISLTYEDPGQSGKTTAHTDTYHGRFVKLVPIEQVVQAMEFETSDAAMRGEMTATFTLTDSEGGTDVHAVHDNLPPGLSSTDNEIGWRMSLGNLAAYVEGRLP